MKEERDEGLGELEKMIIIIMMVMMVVAMVAMMIGSRFILETALHSEGIEK